MPCKKVIWQAEEMVVDPPDEIEQGLEVVQEVTHAPVQVGPLVLKYTCELTEQTKRPSSTHKDQDKPANPRVKFRSGSTLILSPLQPCTRVWYDTEPLSAQSSTYSN